MACAIRAAERGISVALWEKQARPGRKLLISGTGQCNLTHSGPIEDFLSRYGERDKGRFVKPALYDYTNRDLCDFFRARNVFLEETEGGKIFPASRQAKEILDLLLALCEENGVHVATNREVVSVEKTEGGFTIRGTEETVHAKTVVLATGGRSYPGTGSTGDGYRFAASLGHTITPIRAGLTPMFVADYEFTDCSGITIRDAVVVCNRRTHRGPVLLTHRGVSGPGILDFSRFLQAGDTLRINWLGDTKPHELEKRLVEVFREEGKRTLKNTLLFTGIPERLIVALLRHARIASETPACYATKEHREKIVALLTSFPMKIAAPGGFDEAMVTVGGVTLKEVDRTRLESRLTSGLYFCGEVLDIDGDTGGYNLQFAFSSGFLVGKKIGITR